LQMNWQKKCGVSVIFGVGILSVLSTHATFYSKLTWTQCLSSSLLPAIPYSRLRPRFRQHVPYRSTPFLGLCRNDLRFLHLQRTLSFQTDHGIGASTQGEALSWLQRQVQRAFKSELVLWPPIRVTPDL
jgi:hypothetical protein